MEITSLKERILELLARIKEMENLIQVLNLSEEEKNHLIHSLKQQLADKSAEIQSLLDKIAHLTKLKNEVDLLYKQLTNEVHTLRQTIISLEDRINNQDQLIQKLRAELDAANHQIDYKDKQIAALEAKIKQLKDDLRRKHEEW